MNQVHLSISVGPAARIRKMRIDHVTKVDRIKVKEIFKKETNRVALDEEQRTPAYRGSKTYLSQSITLVL